MSLQGTNVKQFPPITKPRALEIAAQVCNDQSGEFVCHSQKPENYHFYVTYPNQPCWYVYHLGQMEGWRCGVVE